MNTKKNTKKHVGDPTPASPIVVGNNKDYMIMTDYVANSYWPSAAEIVVKHKETETYWRAVYAVREDDSEAEYPATWREVVPEQVTITKYKSK